MVMKTRFKRREGVLPEVWETKPFGAVLQRARLGGNYPNQDQEATYPLMKMGNLSRGHFDLSKIEYISPGVTPDPADRLRQGDVLFNTRNTLDLVGKVAMWRGELPVAFYNSNLMRLEFNPQEVSAEYANYALNSAQGVTRLRAMATGTTSVAAIYTRDLLRMPFVVPPIEEQRAIATALGDVDALLDGVDRLIAKKRDLKQAAMQQLLSGQTRLPGFSGEWEVRKLAEIAVIGSGGTPSRENPRYWNGNIPWITTSQIDFNEISHAEQFITDAGLRNSSAKLLPPGTLLMALYGQGKTRGKVGMLAISAATNQACASISVLPGTSAEFVRYALTAQYETIRTASNGGSQDNLSGRIVRELPLSLPLLREQVAIVAVFSDMDAELIGLVQRREKTRLLKQGMMQELLTGRTRLQ